MRAKDEEDKELLRWRQKAGYWKEQYARAEEELEALLKRKKELEAQGRKHRKKLKERQAFETELRRTVQLLEVLLQKQQVPGRDSPDSARRDDAPGEGQDVS